MSKGNKTSKALAVMVMEVINQEIEQHPELREIQGVIVRRAERHNPEASNWDAVFELVGYDANGRPIPVPVAPPSAYEIVRKLQSQYDLV